MRTNAWLTTFILLTGAILTGGADGHSIVGWGYNYWGQATPPAGDDFVAIAAGYNHGIALKSDGSLVGWGLNPYGEANPPSGTGFAKIAAGDGYSLALRSDGSLVGWGFNVHGQINVPAGNDFIDVAAGAYDGFAIRSDGSLVSWGWNADGQANVPAGNNFVDVAAGYNHAVALRADGSLVAWGANPYGQTSVPAGNDFVAVAAGYDHSGALRSNGSIAAWGAWYGEADPPTGNDFVAIAIGSNHGLAVRTDGSLAAWGFNNFGQMDVPSDNDFVAVAAGSCHSLALKAASPPPQATVEIQWGYVHSIFISNPLKDSPHFQMDAVASPAGGSFKWEIMSGQDKIRFLSPAEGTLANHMVIQGIAPSNPSEMYGDVGIKVTYTIGSQPPAQDSIYISVVQPSSVSVYAIGSLEPYGLGGYERVYQFQVMDQKGSPLTHWMNVDEKRRKVYSNAKGIWKHIGLGSGGGPTNANGIFEDQIALGIGVPADFLAKVEQQMWVEGWKVATRCQIYHATDAESVEGPCP